MRRAGRVGLAVVLALLLFAAPPAQAQGQTETCRAPVISMPAVPASFAPGDSFSLSFAIENPNGPPIESVRATVTTTAPAGWTAFAAQRELTLGPRGVEFDFLAITAPNRGTGVASGNITLLVTFVCTSGEIQTSASSSVTLEVAMEGFSAPWPLVLGAFLVLAAGVTVLGVRRLRRGVALVPVPAERPVEAGKSVKFTLVVENRRGKPQRLRFVAGDLPEGWSAHLALPEVELEPGEEKTLWAILRAPASATPGSQVDVVLRLEGATAREGAAAHVRARVVAPPG